ncbi:VanZ family protein [Nitrosomonas sp. Nm58]|uniref:VanZ family protein n=1 Tax=Nitrosomonas sp. Nm58 TaxID=200126 RepID=UPI000B83C153
MFIFYALSMLVICGPIHLYPNDAHTMNAESTKIIPPFIWPLGVMSGLYAVSSISGEPPDDPTLIHAVFSWFSPTVHNMLHVPAYALLAWTLCRCLFLYLHPWVGLPLVVTIAGAYGALLEWHQFAIPGRYASLTDVALNFIGAVIGAWFAWKSAATSKTA